MNACDRDAAKHRLGSLLDCFSCLLLAARWLLEIDIGDRRRQFNCVRMGDRGRGPITRAVPSRQHGVEAKATYLSDQ